MFGFVFYGSINFIGVWWCMRTWDGLCLSANLPICSQVREECLVAGRLQQLIQVEVLRFVEVVLFVEHGHQHCEVPHVELYCVLAAIPSNMSHLCSLKAKFRYWPFCSYTLAIIFNSKYAFHLLKKTQIYIHSINNTRATQTKTIN